MDNNVLSKISAGVYLLGTVDNGRRNGCIIDTCAQVAWDPNRIIVSVMKSNLTCEMIGHSGVFALSILDRSVTFDTISRFGHQSGRQVDKFDGMNFWVDAAGCPFVDREACGVINCRVVGHADMGSHIMYVGEVMDAKSLSKNEPLLYSQYQAALKPKAEIKQTEIPGMKKYVCNVCGYVYDPAKGDPDSGIGPGTAFEDIPDNWVCPLCGVKKEQFSPVG